MKTGTVPRLAAHSIDYSRLEVQHSDNPPTHFSYSSKGSYVLPQLPCHITYTNEQTHAIIRAGHRPVTDVRRDHQGSRGADTARRSRIR